MITLINVFLADRVIAERCGVEAVEHCYPNRPIPVRGQLHERVIVTVGPRIYNVPIFMLTCLYFTSFLPPVVPPVAISGSLKFYQASF